MVIVVSPTSKFADDVLFSGMKLMQVL